MRLRHGHIVLELRELHRGKGLPLLLLHELRGSSADWERPLPWCGPVYGLDFCGHGRSGWVGGGGYYPELLAGDADAALAYLGRAAVVGAGLGAYVALMVAGARASSVPAALLLPGAGLEGAGPEPEYNVPFPPVDTIAGASVNGFDPFVELLEFFVRPQGYACDLAGAAHRILLAEGLSERPPWCGALCSCANVEVVSGGHAEMFERLSEACEEQDGCAGD